MPKKSNKKKMLPLRVKDSLMAEAVRRGSILTFIVSFALFAVFGIAFYYFVLSGMLESKKAIQREVESKEAENIRGAAIEKSQPQFEQEFRKLVNLSNEAEPLLPNETELSEMLLSVQNIAREENVTLTGLNAIKPSQKATLSYYDEKGEVKPADKVYEREIPTQIMGGYSEVVKFFYRLRTLPRIIVVRDFTLYAKSDREVAANFTLMIYHAPPPGEMKPLPAFLNTSQTAVTPIIKDDKEKM